MILQATLSRLPWGYTFAMAAIPGPTFPTSTAGCWSRWKSAWRRPPSPHESFLHVLTSSARRRRRTDIDGYRDAALVLADRYEQAAAARLASA